MLTCAGSLKSSRRVIGISLVLLASALFAGGWVVGQEPRPIERTLPDRSPIGLLGTTYGDRHEFVLGSPWRRFLYRLLPPPGREGLGVTMGSLRAYTPNGLAVWFLRRGPYSRMYQPLKVAAVDERGVDYPPISFSQRVEPAGARVLQGFAMGAFPRRRPTLKVRAFNPTDPARTLAEWTLTNPDARPHPTWTAESLPAARAAGPLQVRLVDVVSGMGDRGAGRRTKPGERMWSRLTFELPQGIPAGAWRPSLGGISDATGNWWWAGSLASGRGTRRWLDLESALSPVEGVYKLKIDWEQTGGYSKEQIWTARGVTLEWARSGSPVSLSHSFGRRRLTLLESLSPSTSLVAGGGVGMLLGTNGVRVALDDGGVPDARVRLLSAVDDRGRRLGVQVTPKWIGADRQVFAFAARPGGRSADLTFAVSTGYATEFTVRPRWVGP